MSQSRTIVGLGEVLWDVFPDGTRFGGAPANFICSVAGLGGSACDAVMLSSVGDDELGRQAIAELRQRRVDTSHVAVQSKPTGQVNIQLDGEGKASYEFAEGTAWDNLAWTDDLEKLAERTSAVCFGTLGQRSPASRETIQRFVATTPTSTLRIFDINLRPPFVDEDVIERSLQLANVLKLNDEELPFLASKYNISGQDVEVMRQLAQRHGLNVVALTRGSHGSILLRGDDVDKHSGASAKVVDTVGAGDAFTATLTLGLLANHELAVINQAASQVAAYVCSQPGATPSMPEELSAITS